MFLYTAEHVRKIMFFTFWDALLEKQILINYKNQKNEGKNARQGKLMIFF